MAEYTDSAAGLKGDHVSIEFQTTFEKEKRGIS